jgi:hypothetical protein
MPMPELVAMIQTTWPHIRVGLYRYEDGRFRFAEEGLRPGETGGESWRAYHESGFYDGIATARAAMVEHYCQFTEDEFKVAPESVTVLEAPDFQGPHHPVLIQAR